MSRHACLDLINAYLNRTAGGLANQPGEASANPVQYTKVKENGVCGHNPNVVIRSDEEINQDLSRLAARP
jgi:hypothetical protein